jgi:hypothetical protein
MYPGLLLDPLMRFSDYDRPRPTMPDDECILNAAHAPGITTC